jgi:hypothetical protein
VKAPDDPFFGFRFPFALTGTRVAVGAKRARR